MERPLPFADGYGRIWYEGLPEPLPAQAPDQSEPVAHLDTGRKQS